MTGRWKGAPSFWVPGPWGVTYLGNSLFYANSAPSETPKIRNLIAHLIYSPGLENLLIHQGKQHSSLPPPPVVLILPIVNQIVK